MLWTFPKSFSFIVLKPDDELGIFYIFLANLVFQLPWQPMKLWALDKNYTCMFGRRPPNKHFWISPQKYWQRNSNKYQFSFFPLQVNRNFQLPQQPKYISISNKFFIEVNVMAISAKFELHPLNGFWGDDFFFFFANLAFWLTWQPIKSSSQDKIHMVSRGLLKEHVFKTFVKISGSEIAINANFLFSHCKSMATVSCHSKNSSYPI